jgi:hypothetical protein
LALASCFELPPQQFAIGESNDDEKLRGNTPRADIGRIGGAANAQLTTTFKAQVPFDFVVNGKTMAAGECTIAIDVNGRTLLSISNGKHHIYAFPIAAKSPNAAKNTALVFHRYGDRFFLADIKRENGTGYQLPASRLEDELRVQNVTGEVLTLLASAK